MKPELYSLFTLRYGVYEPALQKRALAGLTSVPSPKLSFFFRSFKGVFCDILFTQSVKHRVEVSAPFFLAFSSG